jgi:hypothetical protein
VLLFVGSVRVRYTASDPRGSLLVSAAIIEHGDVKLDPYAAAVEGYGNVVVRRDGHIYYFFPLGTPFSSVPFVYLFLLAGYDLTNEVNEANAQIVTASVVAVLTVWLLYVIARHYLSDWASWALALAFWLSTPLVSTNATALWSHDFACLYALTAIHLMLTWQARGDGVWWRGGVIALVLVMAYLCRPTLSLLGILSVVAIAWSNRRLAVWMSGFGAAFFALFVLFSLREFGQVLPRYYLPRRLWGGPTFRRSYVEALVGNLISPSRGLLVFCPFLIVTLPHAGRLFRYVKDHAFVIVLGLVWPVMHWLVVSAFPLWWGGWSFGPRLMSDALPGLFLLLCAALSSARNRRITVAFAVSLFVVSMWINAWQGCFNPYTDEWNADPNVEEFPHYLFDWRYPQFLHDARRHDERKRMHLRAHFE